MIDVVAAMLAIGFVLAFMLALGWTVYYGVLCVLDLFEDW